MCCFYATALLGKARERIIPQKISFAAEDLLSSASSAVDVLGGPCIHLAK